MKINLLFIITIFFPVFILAQGVTKNAEGESTILLGGSSIGLDVGKTQLSFGINNLQQSIGEKPTFIGGGFVTGANKEGISNLFSKGDFVPDASINAFAGISFSNGTNDKLEKIEKERAIELAKWDNNFLEIYRLLMSIELKKLPDGLNEEREKLLIILLTVTEISTFSKAVGEIKSEDLETKKTLKEIDVIHKSLVETYESKRKIIENKYEKATEEAEPKGYIQCLFFSYGGFNGSEFKRFVGYNSVDLNESFVDQSFRGGRVGLGTNIKIYNFSLGFNYGYIKTNNFTILTKKDYSLKSSITENGQTLSEEKKITAYSGEYGTVEFNELNADIIYSLKLDPEAKNHVLINPYIRSQLMSRKSSILPNSTNLGCGFYFFKNDGLFLGGFYTELQDVNNNYERAKPEADQNLREPIERLTFGIVAKFSFNSILN